MREGTSARAHAPPSHGGEPMNDGCPPGNGGRMMRTSLPGTLVLMLALVGCDGGPGTPTDSGPDVTPTDAGGGDVDGSTPTDAGSPGADAGPAGDDAGPPGDGGGVPACGEGPAEPGTFGIPRSCRRPECFDATICIGQQLEGLGYVGYAGCGMRLEIDPTSSNDACNEDPPFGGFETPQRCGLLSYTGHVLFFCAPDGSEVVARFSALFSPPDTTVLYHHLGHEFWAGSGGGSGDSYSLSWPTDDFGERFVGFQSVGIPPSGSVRLVVWFLSGDFAEPHFIAGGFAADLPPT